MYCGNCGKEILENAKFCQYCGTVQDEKTNQVAISTTQQINNYKNIDKVEQQVDNHLANILCTISLILYFGGPIVSTLLSMIRYVTHYNVSPIYDGIISLLMSLSGLSILAAYVLMIIARVKCPTSKYAKIVMWIYIILLALEVIAIIILAIACGWWLGNCLEGLGSMG